MIRRNPNEVAKRFKRIDFKIRKHEDMKWNSTDAALHEEFHTHLDAFIQTAQALERRIENELSTEHAIFKRSLWMLIRIWWELWVLYL